ncbi:hypothetical protein FACS18945_2560 [Bacteroidia bacterium]|nr:hypothetical protein FACS189434_12830 [Bacteroidia bacterium]GHT57687.1 hypothetical protein FACS18945_2560 [Bacteroidia bacterium]
MFTATRHRTANGQHNAVAQPNRLYGYEEKQSVDFPRVKVVATPRKREIGFLDGIAKVTFSEDWKMTPEELGMV